MLNFSRQIFQPALLLFMASSLVACNNNNVHVGEKEIVEKPEDINVKAEEVIKGTLKEILQNSKEINDSIKIKNAAIVQQLYDVNAFQPLWTSNGTFTKYSDALFTFFDSTYYYGLFPQDYYNNKLTGLRHELTNTTSAEIKLDAGKWAYCDLLLTSAFVQIVKDLSKGRILPDSILVKDTSLSPAFFSSQFTRFKMAGGKDFASGLEPQHEEYKKLKQALGKFLTDVDFKNHTQDTMVQNIHASQVYKHLNEDSLLSGDADSATISEAIKKYQQKKGLPADGRISPALISKLREADKEKFIRIAITLDKYKMLQPLPQQYIWVNIPSYHLQVRDKSAVVLRSKVIVGKPITQTPEVSSTITEMITYPQWHIPESIIKKDILPGLKRNPGYTIRKGYTLLDRKGNEVDPYSVKWLKYKNGIPFAVVQGSGDANALGVMKFNFPNAHSVYLHDTNQRYLFSRSSRALSHGCVRVQAWQELSNFILKNDSTSGGNYTPIDSVNNWLALKEKHVIPVQKKLPLYIRYFTCEAKDDKITFYDDIYGEDRKLRELYFSDK